ncbi:hypothetical protein VJ918_05820 [Adlercreutzia sp. R21]|uniref:hypothetical protein n=1 Tax=Adlercreutzia wanghongyangiae TaxID=3111451 RepID=UPI002DB98DA1|nr:hypothetical protein [Adlercreutzia sp. R21]MEC4184325.1 hypothetical protein [Adlercreutzia sp. R21]
MRIGVRSGVRRAVAALAGLALACGLTACQGGNAEDAANSEGSSQGAVLGLDYATFDEQMTALPTNYTYEYEEAYTLGAEGTGEQGVIHYTAQTDGLDADFRQHTVYAEDDSFLPGGEFYQEGDTVIRIDDDMPVDVTASVQEEEPAQEELEGFNSAGFLYALNNLVDVTTEGDDTVYRFVFEEGEAEGDYGMVDEVTRAEDICRINAAGQLVEEVVKVEGTADVDGSVVPASSETTIRYSQWGATEVPAAPEPEGKQVTVGADEAAAALRDCIQGLPSNFSTQTETEVTGTADGQAQTNEVYAEALIDRADTPKGATYVELDGNEDDAVMTFFAGDRVVVVQHDEIVSDERTGAPVDPTGSERALAVVDSARVIDQYDYNDGSREYVLEADVSKLGESVAFDGLETLTSLTANYYLDAEGNLASVVMRVGGTAAGATLDLKASTVYYDLGTTEVPAMP